MHGIGRNAAFIDCKVDVFASENIFFKVLGESDCTMCGNLLMRRIICDFENGGNESF